MYKNSLGGPEAAGGTWKSGGQSRPPLQPVLENRVQVEKPPRCPFCVVGVTKNAEFWREDRVVRPYNRYWKTVCRSKTRRDSNSAPGRADAYIDPPETPVLWRFSGKCVKLRFHAVGVDAHIDPPSKMEIPPRGGGWTLLYRVSIFTP